MWAAEMQEMTEMEIRCERRGQKVMKWKKASADGDRRDKQCGNRGEGRYEEDRKSDRVFPVAVCATHRYNLRNPSNNLQQISGFKDKEGKYSLSGWWLTDSESLCYKIIV